ncbi:MAG TPA: penicillin-binding protein activator [Sphingomicrobium sp.]|nr:penicillin-binding protein activator [Sphingomicrobium sp.]
MTSSSAIRQARRPLLVLLAVAILAACRSGPTPRTDLPVIVPPGAKNKVALIVPLSGVDGPIGTSISRAAALALIDTNNQQIVLTVYDSSVGGAAAAARQALAAGNELILGPLTAADARAVAPIVRQASVPVITFSNDSGVAGDGVFILGTVPSESIDRVIGYAKARGAARFGGLVPKNLYGERISLGLLGAAQKAKVTVGGIQSYGQTAASVRSAAATLASKGRFDAVLVGDTPATAAIAAASLRFGPRILGTELWGNERAIGKSAALRGAWYAALPNDRFEQLVNRYRAKYGKTPYRLASLGYDAMLLTVRTSKYWEPGRPFPARRLIDRDGFAGVDGIFRFGRDGIAERALEVRQVTASGSTLLSPAPATFAD